MKIKAPAKINLVLDVLGQSSDGYHHIATIFQQIPLYDELIFHKLPTSKIILTCNNPELPTGQRNLVLKAVKILQEYKSKNTQIAGRSWRGLSITLKKNIPVAMGLGGGSSDAAATLKALNHLWNLKLSSEKLQQLGAKIGMDVPFFIRGGTGYGSHYGEKIHPLPHLKIPALLLIIPRKTKKISTKNHYQIIDHHAHGHQSAKTKELLGELGKKTGKLQVLAKTSSLFHNDFDVLYSHELISLQEKLIDMGAQAVHCTGSGPAIYAVFPDRGKLRKAVIAINKSMKNTWYCLSQNV